MTKATREDIKLFMKIADMVMTYGYPFAEKLVDNYMNKNAKVVLEMEDFDKLMTEETTKEDYE